MSKFKALKLSLTRVDFSVLSPCEDAGDVVRDDHQEESEGRQAEEGGGLVSIPFNVLSNICRITQMKKLTGVRKCFCDSNFYILSIKCKRTACVSKLGDG